MSDPTASQRPTGNTQSSLIKLLDSDQFDWFETVGGWRGMAESTIPLLVFVVAYTLTHNLWWSTIGAAGVSVVFLVVRTLARLPLTPAISGMLGVGISYAWASWSGKDENYFAFGIITATLWALVLGVSLLIGRPAAGYALSWVWDLPDHWMNNLAYTELKKRCSAVTLLWLALFAVRVCVQIPLWLGAQVEYLGVAKIVLGLPLFAVVAWLTWLGLRPFSALNGAHTKPADDSDPGD